jgi:N-acetyl-anhydromuramyl-L-alanine amidase AmpD
MLDLAKIKSVKLPAGQWETETAPKKQIVLHHTGSGEGAQGDINTWANTPEKVATAFVIERTGQIVQLYPSGQWGYHLGLSHPRWPQHDRQSIGIEIDSWGALTEKGGKYYTWTNREIAADKVITYPGTGYRGFKHYEKYTAEQIQAVKDLVEYLATKYKIPAGFDRSIFDINQRALDQQAGVFAHSSYRKDKTDAHPQPELLNIGARFKTWDTTRKGLQL